MRTILLGIALGIGLGIGTSHGSDMMIEHYVAPGDSTAGPFSISVAASDAESLVTFEIHAHADTGTIAQSWALFELGSAETELTDPGRLFCRVQPSRKSATSLEYEFVVGRRLIRDARFDLLTTASADAPVSEYVMHLVEFCGRR